MSRSVSPAFEIDGSDSESESPVTTMLGGMSENPDAQRYFRAMVDAQQEVGRLKAENKALKTELYELKLSSARTARGRKAKPLSPAPGPASSASISSASLSAALSASASESTSDPNANTVALIRRIGWYHQMNCTPVVLETAFGVPKPAFPHDSVERYVDVNLHLGATVDLYHCTPRDYHSKIANGSEAFQHHYVHGAGAGLASALHRLCSVSGQVFDIKQDVFRNLEVAKRSRRSKTVPTPAADLEMSVTSRAKNPTIHKLLGITSVTTVSNGKTITMDIYADIPPFLFKPGHERNMKYLFQNPQMYQLARAVIYGPSNVDAMEPTLHKNNPYRHADGRAIEATSGMIAWFGVMIEYTLSPDQEFASGGIGTHTSTDYLAKHARYRRLLIEGYHNKNATITRIFCEWNKNVFPRTKTADEDSSSEDEDRIETQRRARDGAQPITDLLSQMSEFDAGDSPNSEEGSAQSDVDDSDTNTINGETTIILQNLSISTRPSSPASPGPNTTQPNSPTTQPSGVHGRRLVCSRDIANVNSDGNTLIDHYHISSADFNATIPSFSNSTNPTPSATISRPSGRISRRSVISVCGAAVNPDLVISDSISTAVPAIVGNSSGSAPAVNSNSAGSGPSNRPGTSKSVTVAMPAPRRASNRNKQADIVVADSTDRVDVPVTADKPVNARGRGGKVGKKSRGA